MLRCGVARSSSATRATSARRCSLRGVRQAAHGDERASLAVGVGHAVEKRAADVAGAGGANERVFLAHELRLGVGDEHRGRGGAALSAAVSDGTKLAFSS
jgi:hypothetical protein